MALITKSDLGQYGRGFGLAGVGRGTARQGLLKEAASPLGQSYDVFLSHSSRDAEEVIRVKMYVEAHGFSVYVDWVDDADTLNRGAVEAATATRIRLRIQNSVSLLVYATRQARESRWVPWELGYADGLGRRVAILPVVEQATERFDGSEYLGLYHYVDESLSTGSGTRLFVNEQRSAKYIEFGEWLKGNEPRVHP